MDLIVEKYSLAIIDKLDSTCSVSIQPKTGLALNTERRKLYIISTEEEILYVGEANSSILKRFQRSTVSYNHFVRNGKSRNGYKGYKWLNKAYNQKRNLTVSVVIFSDDYDHEHKRGFIEAIEGELVYLIRNRFGYWPKFQNEIHFSNCVGAKEIAESILKKAFSGELV